MNAAWCFSRLEYSPAPNRDMWAVTSSGARRPPAPSFRDWLPSGAGWAGEEGRGAAEEATPLDERAIERLAHSQQVRAERQREQAVASLAQRVAAQRAQRQAFHRLLAHAREATAAALARSPARHAAGQVEEVEPAGQASEPWRGWLLA